MAKPTQQQIANLIDQGLTIEDIARMFNVNEKQVRKWLEMIDEQPVIRPAKEGMNW